MMRVLIAGVNVLSQNIRARLEQEEITVDTVEASVDGLSQCIHNKGCDLFIALDDHDETNLVLCALVKQLGAIKTVASLKNPAYIDAQQVAISKAFHSAFHVDHIIFPDLLVEEKIAQIIFNEGIYSRSFLYGNVLLRTMRVTENCPFAGKTLAEVRDKHKDMLVCLIHRPHKILATSQNQNQLQQLVGAEDELVFAHGKDLLLADDEITMIGETKAVIEACSVLTSEKKLPISVCIVGSGVLAEVLADRIKKHGVEVLAEKQSMPIDSLKSVDVFIACHSNEEHNFVLSVQAKDSGVGKVIAVLSDKATRGDAQKLGIHSVSSAPISAADSVLELVQAGNVTSVMSLYDARAEILQVSISVHSSIVGIPLSILGPTLPKEILIGVIYSRGRIFIAGGTHILKPQDECLVIASPKHRALLEKIL